MKVFGEDTGGFRCDPGVQEVLPVSQRDDTSVPWDIPGG